MCPDADLNTVLDDQSRADFRQEPSLRQDEISLRVEELLGATADIDLDAMLDQDSDAPGWIEGLLASIGFAPAPSTAGDPLGDRPCAEGGLQTTAEDWQCTDIDTVIKEALASLEDAPQQPAKAPKPSDWPDQRRALPGGVVELLDEIVRVDAVKSLVVARAEASFFLGIPAELLDPAAREAAWAFAWSPARQADTVAWLGRLRDAVVREIHLESTYEHAVYSPSELRSWRHKDGVLTVDDLDDSYPACGQRSFLEQTPPKIFRWCYEMWRREQGKATNTAGVWDLTAGSGTGTDLLTSMYGCRIVSSDLTLANERVVAADVRNVGTIIEHGGRLPMCCGKWMGCSCPRCCPDLPRPEVVRHPDIVFIDLGSRGRPLHSELYFGPEGGLDAAALDRADYVDLTASAVREAAARLAPKGFVSLLVRHGVRDGQKVTADDKLLGRIGAALGEGLRIVHEMPIRFRKRCNQVSLGTARVPATHLWIRATP